MTESPESKEVVDLLARTLFAEFLHIAKHAENPSDDMMQRVLRHIEDHSAEQRCLQEAKRLSGYSETAFIYKFKAATGQTPSRYL